MARGQHGTRRRPPARVLDVPPPGGPTLRPPPRPVGARPARPASLPRHRKQRVRLGRRGWVRLPVAAVAVLAAALATTWVVTGRGGGARAAPAAAQALPSPVAAPTAVTTQLRPDGVPVAVATAVEAAGGSLGVAVFDATSGRLWSYQDRPRVEASVSKLQLLGAQLRALGSRAPSTAVDRDLSAMIRSSDNDAADDVYARVGRAGMAAFDAAVGATGVVAAPQGRFGLDTATAADLVAVERALAYPTGVLTDAARARATGYLAAVTKDQRWGATAGVPDGVTVSVKDGWLPVAADGGRWAVNTVAHVSGAGRDYVVAVLSDGNVTEQAGIDRVEQVCRAVWASAPAALPTALPTAVSRG